MNILITHKGIDLVTYKTLGILSRNKTFKIYITVPSDKEALKVEENCIPIRIPSIKSKFSFKVIKSLRSIIKQKKIDLVFSPSTAGLSNSLFASIGTNVKNVGYRGTQAKVKKYDPTYYMGLLNPRVNHIVCETKDIYDYLSHYIDDRKLSIGVKPFDVDWVKDAYLSPKKVEGIPDNAFKCIYIGDTKGRPFKGLTFLIKAFQILNDLNIHLIVIGDYDNSDYCLAQNGLNKKCIHFLGRREDAIRFLPKEDLFILPALRDASPRVVRESMACGVPCIVTDIPGARDLIIDNESGLLVPPHSPEKIAEAILQLKNDSLRLEKLAKASRERIINDFCVEDYVNYFEKMFLNLNK